MNPRDVPPELVDKLIRTYEDIVIVNTDLSEMVARELLAAVLPEQARSEWAREWAEAGLERLERERDDARAERDDAITRAENAEATIEGLSLSAAGAGINQREAEAALAEETAQLEAFRTIANRNAFSAVRRQREIEAELAEAKAQIPQCNGMCLRASDVLDDLSHCAGNPIARAHRSCPLHGDLEDVAKELDSALTAAEAELAEARAAIEPLRRLHERWESGGGADRFPAFAIRAAVAALGALKPSGGES